MTNDNIVLKQGTKLYTVDYAPLREALEANKKKQLCKSQRMSQA